MDVNELTTKAEARQGCSIEAETKLLDPDQTMDLFNQMVELNKANRAADSSGNYLSAHTDAGEKGGKTFSLVSGRGLLGIPIVSIDLNSDGKKVSSKCYGD